MRSTLKVLQGSRTIILYVLILFLRSSIATPFNVNPFTQDTVGTLMGEVVYLQSHLIPHNLRVPSDVQPHLVARRHTMVMIRLASPSNPMNVSLSVHASEASMNGGIGGTFGEDFRVGGKGGSSTSAPRFQVSMNPPQTLPSAMDGFPRSLAFGPSWSLAVDYTVSGSESNGITASQMVTWMNLYRNLRIYLRNGEWTDTIYLPDSAARGSVVNVVTTAPFPSTVRDNKYNRVWTFEQANLQFMKGDVGWWIEYDEQSNFFEYGPYWWAVIPYPVIVPGMVCVFTSGVATGTVRPAVGGFSDLSLSIIDVGLLTAPRGVLDVRNAMQGDRQIYFQSVPLSRLKVAAYESVEFPTVMMPSGEVYTGASTTSGSATSGNLRTDFSIGVVAMGIQQANVGRSSTAGDDKSSPPGVAQATVEMLAARYSNGVIAQNIASDGAGSVVIGNTRNDLSIGLGYTFGLSINFGGGSKTIHQPTNVIGSTWGWNYEKNVFTPNIERFPRTGNTCVLDLCLPPWNSPYGSLPFRKDVMSGGGPIWGHETFGLYTPNSAVAIQQYVESRATFSERSSTGFVVWSPSENRMVAWSNNITVLDVYSATPADIEPLVNGSPELNISRAKELLTRYDVLLQSWQNGNWASRYLAPAAAMWNAGKYLQFFHNASSPSTLSINGGTVSLTTGTSLTYRSNGIAWVTVAMVPITVARRPSKFAVPVTTILGLYDPTPPHARGGFVFPPLHGSQGYVYPDDGAYPTCFCQLRVKRFDGGLESYCLRAAALSSSMNKFHVNVAATSQPTSAAVYCGTSVLANATLSPRLNTAGFASVGVSCDDLAVESESCRKLENSRVLIPSVWLGSNNRTNVSIAVYPISLPFSQAEGLCSTAGGKLASPFNSEYQSVTAEAGYLYSGGIYTPHTAWIGGIRQGLQWLWSTNVSTQIFYSGGGCVPGAYCAWDAGRPTGSGDCMMMSLSSRWANDDCTTPRFFLCEVPYTTYYQCYVQPTPWNDALTFCRLGGGWLATFPGDSASNLATAASCTGAVQSNARLRIGADSFGGPVADFRWTQGILARESARGRLFSRGLRGSVVSIGFGGPPWGIGEPNNAGSGEPTVEISAGQMRLNDLEVTTIIDGLVCEFPARPTTRCSDLSPMEVRENGTFYISCDVDTSLFIYRSFSAENVRFTNSGVTIVGDSNVAVNVEVTRCTLTNSPIASIGTFAAGSSVVVASSRVELTRRVDVGQPRGMAAAFVVGGPWGGGVSLTITQNDVQLTTPSEDTAAVVLAKGGAFGGSVILADNSMRVKAGQNAHGVLSLGSLAMSGGALSARNNTVQLYGKQRAAWIRFGFEAPATVSGGGALSVSANAMTLDGDVAAVVDVGTTTMSAGTLDVSMNTVRFLGRLAKLIDGATLAAAVGTRVAVKENVMKGRRVWSIVRAMEGGGSLLLRCNRIDDRVVENDATFALRRVPSGANVSMEGCCPDAYHCLNSSNKMHYIAKRCP